MEIVETQQSLSPELLTKMFSDFMTRIAKFEELVTFGSRLLIGFRQALGFIARPPFDKISALVERLMKAHALVERLMKAHGTNRFLSYIEAGCMNSSDSVLNVSQLHTCHLGLQDHINKAKIILTELRCLLDDVALIMQSVKKQEEVNPDLDSLIPSNDDEEYLSLDPSKPQDIDYAALMAIIYSMIKQDYRMQESIVSSLSLKSSQGELETYCQMWSLRPYVEGHIMHEAWSLIS